MTRWAAALALTLAIATLGCEPRAEGGEGEHAEHEHEHGEGEHAEAPVTWVEVTRPGDASLLELPARVVAAPDSRAHLDTPLRGTVVSISTRVGDRVEAGAALIELRIPAVLEAAAILAGTSKQIGSHKARRERLEQLEAAGLVNAGEVFDIQSGLGRLSAERRVALATLAAVGVDADARSEVLARGTVVFTAPIAGVVARIDAVPGEVVEPGEGLLQILGRGSARIEVAYGGELGELTGVGDDSNSALDGASLEFIGLDGSVVALAPSPVTTAIEPGLGRVLAWYETADQTLRLPDGVRGRVVLHSADPKLLEVPRRALRLDQGHAWVGRRPEGGGPAQMVEVEVLRSAGSSALIRSEALAVGDRIAADATSVLLLGREAGELGGGHSH